MIKTAITVSAIALTLALTGCGESTEYTTQTGGNSGGQIGGNTDPGADYPTTPGPKCVDREDGVVLPGCPSPTAPMDAVHPCYSDPESELCAQAEEADPDWRDYWPEPKPVTSGGNAGPSSPDNEAANGEGGTIGGSGVTEAEDTGGGNDGPGG